jgi:lipopolysaccharide transport system ATP-binding protein
MTSLARIHERGATVLFVSHDIGVLKSLCSRGICLDGGRVQEIGPAGEVAEHYVRRMRDETNAGHASTYAPSAAMARTGASPEGRRGTDGHEFKTSRSFEKQVSRFRYGDGGARITFAELLDEDMQSVDELAFDQGVLVRIYFETSIDAEVSCNYYVLDEKKNLVVGAGLTLVDQPFIHAENGGRYVVTYKTRLPLHEGNYSVQLQITTPIVLGQSARFLDVIDDALVFRMSRREGARIWTNVYIENQVEIKTC